MLESFPKTEGGRRPGCWRLSTRTELCSRGACAGRQLGEMAACEQEVNAAVTWFGEQLYEQVEQRAIFTERLRVHFPPTRARTPLWHPLPSGRVRHRVLKRFLPARPVRRSC